jgi:DNA-binding FrmR family transcriptional regulator
MKGKLYLKNWKLSHFELKALHRVPGYNIINAKEADQMAFDLENEDLSADSCCSIESERKSHHSEKVKKNLTTRLNRIEGQIRGIKGLIDRDVYCDDIITQISATQSALNSVAKLLLEGHLKSCVVERIHEGDEEVLDEFLITIQKLMKK